MFLLIPWNTDAPLYHRPWGTIGLILLNVLIFAATFAEPRLAENLALDYGRGFTPLQWVTSNFVHAGFLHLLGNMIFLWGFGLIVEGKLGWKVFVPVYLGIGAAECALEQALFWSQHGGSVGASAIIFGLMAMCLLWAPRNELQIFYLVWLIWLRVGLTEISVVTFSLLNLLMSAIYFLIALLMGTSSSEPLHLLGALVGGGIGLLMLRRKWVDCEGWDLFSVMSGNLPASHTAAMSLGFQEDLRRRKLRKKTKTAKRRAKDSSEGPDNASASSAQPAGEHGSPEKFSRLLGQKKPHAAHQELVKIRHFRPDWKPTDQELLDLARGLRQAKEFDPAVRVYEELISLRPHYSLGRIELATLLALTKGQPSAARRCLEQCDVNSLTQAQRKLYDQLLQKIQALLDSGIVEVDRRV